MKGRSRGFENPDYSVQITFHIVGLVLPPVFGSVEPRNAFFTTYSRRTSEIFTHSFYALHSRHRRSVITHLIVNLIINV